MIPNQTHKLIILFSSIPLQEQRNVIHSLLLFNFLSIQVFFNLLYVINQFILCKLTAVVFFIFLFFTHFTFRLAFAILFNFKALLFLRTSSSFNLLSHKQINFNFIYSKFFLLLRSIFTFTIKNYFGCCFEALSSR